MHGAQDCSSFILLHEHSKVFKIVYTNCPRNVCLGNVHYPYLECWKGHVLHFTWVWVLEKLTWISLQSVHLDAFFCSAEIDNTCNINVWLWKLVLWTNWKSTVDITSFTGVSVVYSNNGIDCVSIHQLNTHQWMKMLLNLYFYAVNWQSSWYVPLITYEEILETVKMNQSFRCFVCCQACAAVYCVHLSSVCTDYSFSSSKVV